MSGDGWTTSGRECRRTKTAAGNNHMSVTDRQKKGTWYRMEEVERWWRRPSRSSTWTREFRCIAVMRNRETRRCDAWASDVIALCCSPFPKIRWRTTHRAKHEKTRTPAERFITVRAPFHRTMSVNVWSIAVCRCVNCDDGDQRSADIHPAIWPSAVQSDTTQCNRFTSGRQANRFRYIANRPSATRENSVQRWISSSECIRWEEM